jgi:hypothetical protein
VRHSSRALSAGRCLPWVFFDLVLDRQAVAVPARHVGGVEAGQGLGADDDVLENLVQRVTDVDVCRWHREGRRAARTWPAGGGLADALVELPLLPVGHPAWLALGEVATHREGGVGQVQGLAVVSHGLAIGVGEIGAHLGDIAGDLRLERFEGLELFLAAQLVHEIDIDMPAVDVAIEIQQVHFQHRLQALGHGGPHADVGGAGKRLRIDPRDGDREHAGQRQALPAHLDVGRRKADGAADLLAVHDAPGDDEGATEQALGTLDVAGGKRVAHGGAGHPQAAEIHRGHGLDDKAMVVAGLLQQAKSPPRALPKRKSSPMIRCRTERPRTRICSMNCSAVRLGQLAIEAADMDAIDTAFRQQLQLVAHAGQARRRLVRRK